MINDLSKLKPNGVKSNLGEIVKTNPFQCIFDESDEISKQTLESKFTNSDSINFRERKIFEKISLPGIERNFMPEKPLKSAQIRKAEKS